MTIELYHGSDHIIEQPELGKGRLKNDYGKGLYCTEERDLAREWGVSRSRDGIVNQYQLETNGLTLLDLGGNEFCVLHWLTVLLENREFDLTTPLAVEAKEYLLEHFRPAYETYDLIKGYRADDSYFSFAQDFIGGGISYRQLTRAMHLGKLGEQVVLKSEAAFARLQYRGYEVASREEWYPKKVHRDRAARAAYFNVEKNRRQKGDLYILQILDEEMKPDDPRLR